MRDEITDGAVAGLPRDHLLGDAADRHLRHIGSARRSGWSGRLPRAARGRDDETPVGAGRDPHSGRPALRSPSSRWWRSVWSA
jgi:hypothetical protein